MRRHLATASLLLAAARGTSAQPIHHPPSPSASQPMDDMPGMHHAAPAVSARARRQIDTVARAVTTLGTPAAATAAGLRPVFGWIPTMGVHWVDPASMTKAAQGDRAHPGQLMFSRVAGKDSLVGAAYGYFVATGDSTPPRLFDGAPAWHEHPELAPDGQTLVMLHVWFVPSPDGPFAGTNPNLPYWAAGLAAPDSARMHDPAFSLLVRRAGLALSEVVDTSAIFPRLEGRPDVRPVLVARRDSVRALVTELKAAEQMKDATRWEAGAAQLGAQWDAMYAAYVASARSADARARMARFVATMLGQHHE